MKACRRLHPHTTSNTFFLYFLFLLREKLDCKLLSVVDMCMDFWTVFWNASRVDCTKCVTTAPWNETWPHKQHFCVKGKPDDDKTCPNLYVSLCHSIKLCFNQREVSSTPRTSLNQPRSRPWKLFRKGRARWTKFWAGDWMSHLSITLRGSWVLTVSRDVMILWIQLPFKRRKSQYTDTDLYLITASSFSYYWCLIMSPVGIFFNKYYKHFSSWMTDIFSISWGH